MPFALTTALILRLQSFQEFYPKDYKKAANELKEVKKLVNYIEVIALNKAPDEDVEISSNENEEEVDVVPVKSLRKEELRAEIRAGKIKSSYRFLNRKPITNVLSFLASILTIVISFFLPQNAPIETHILNILLDGGIVGISTKIISCIIHRSIWKSALKQKYRKIKILNKTIDGYKKQAQKRYDTHREQTKKKYNEAFTKKRNEIIAVEKKKFKEKRAKQKERAEKILKENWSSYLKENAEELSSLLRNFKGLSYLIWERDLEGIPACYREDIETLSNLKGYFQMGRAETIKEAINLYIAEKRERAREEEERAQRERMEKLEQERLRVSKEQNEQERRGIISMELQLQEMSEKLKATQERAEQQQQENLSIMLRGMLAQVKAQNAAADSITSEYQKRNKLLEEQNKKIEEQNRKIEENNKALSDIKHGW